MIFLAPFCALLLLIFLQVTNFSRNAMFLAVLVLAGLTALVPEQSALFMTLVIEAAVVFVLTKMLRLPTLKLILVSLLVNTMTNPLFVQFSLLQEGGSWLFGLIIGEIIVFGTEAFLYIWTLGPPYTGRKAAGGFWLSFLANASSAGIGLLLPI